MLCDIYSLYEGGAFVNVCMMLILTACVVIHVVGDCFVVGLGILSVVNNI